MAYSYHCCSYYFTFGAKKIPEFAKSIGEGMSEFKKATGNHVEKEQKQESVKPHEPEESTSAFSNVKQHTETKNV